MSALGPKMSPPPKKPPTFTFGRRHRMTPDMVMAGLITLLGNAVEKPLVRDPAYTCMTWGSIRYERERYSTFRTWRRDFPADWIFYERCFVIYGTDADPGVIKVVDGWHRYLKPRHKNQFTADSHK